MDNDTENTVVVDPDDDRKNEKTEQIHKHHRKRKRHHLNSIREQMEFYFGDANLTKDRFLRQLIEQDQFVPLDVFLTFNKMKTLTNSVEEIAKCLSDSQLLELDEARQKVRRKTALPVERNVDDKTLYVESLPPTADHEWVRQIFERFGHVTYVSLPKYAKSRRLKEFGFVEFEHGKSVDKAIKAFTEFKGVLNTQEVDPAELGSVKAYVKEQNEQKNILPQDENIKNVLKRPISTKDDTDDQLNAKKLKMDGEDEISTLTEAETVDESNDENQKKDADVTKKRRKKSKTKTALKRQKAADLNTDASYYELKILSKRDWKRLRNKYLNLQREKVAELKRKVWKEKHDAQQQHKENSKDVADTIVTTPSKKSKPNERKFQRMNMNFYGAGEDEAPTKVPAKETKHNPALDRAPLFTYEPGLIVEISFMEPCVNVKEFKADMRQYSTVKYVDVKEGVMHANLRLESAAAAEDLVKQLNCAEYKCKILGSEAEAEYWKKIEKDREMKLNKQVRIPQKRGREKVKKLISKHIHFGDDDE